MNCLYFKIFSVYKLYDLFFSFQASFIHRRGIQLQISRFVVKINRDSSHLILSYDSPAAHLCLQHLVRYNLKHLIEVICGIYCHT